MLEWLDQHPGFHWWVFCAALAVVTGIVLGSIRRGSSQPSKVAHVVWALALLAILLAGRWPSLLVTRGYSQDEYQMLAGAMTLRHDPLFWRSVDGDTAGPFDFYALIPTGSLLGGDTIPSAHLTALLLIWGTVFFAYLLLTHRFGLIAAQISTLSAVVFQAATLHWDFLQYSTELVPIFFLSVALYLGASRFPTTRKPFLVGAAVGALLGAVTLSKLQAGPIAAVVGFYFLSAELIPRRVSNPQRSWRVLGLIVGALLPVGISAVILLLTHQLEHAVIPYVLHNLVYIEESSLGLRQITTDLYRQVSRPGSVFIPWIMACASMLALAGIVAWRERARFNWRLTLFVMAGGVVVLFCIQAPRRPFPHYLQLAFLPLLLATGATVGLALERVRVRTRHHAEVLGLLFLTISLAPLVASRANIDHPALGRLALYHSFPRSDLGNRIRVFGRPGEALALWGFTTSFYVETQMRQAVRDAYSSQEMRVHPYRDYFRRRYLADFIKSQPTVFIDSSELFPGPGFGHDALFPELAELVRRDFTRVPNHNQIRIYVRRDRFQEVHGASSAVAELFTH